MEPVRFQAIKEDLYKLCVSHSPNDHRGFYRDFKDAQKIIINSIFEIEDILISELAKENKDSKQIQSYRIQIAVLKDFANSIAWFLFYANTTTLKAYAGAGPSATYLKNRNLENTLKLLEAVDSDDDTFIMTTDITTAVNLGDILITKKGSPPQVIELKEGEVNLHLLLRLDNDKELSKYLDQLPAKEKFRTEAQVTRLKKQKRRLEMLKTFEENRNSRYDERTGNTTEIVKYEQITSTDYSPRIQQAYDGLKKGEVKIIEISGGLYIQICKRPCSEQDMLTFQHKIYHKLNKISEDDCMLNDQSMEFEDTKKEATGIQEIKIYPGIQGIGGVGFTPATSSIGSFTDELALDLLNLRSMLYFYFDKNEFLELASQSEIPWSIKQKSAQPMFIYNINGLKARLTLSWNFRSRMFIDFIEPKQVIEELELNIKKLAEKINHI